MKKDLINYLEEKLNLKILTIDNLYGGCINESFKLETRSQKYFIKINYNLNLFSLEKEGLETLRSTNTFYIPEVIMHGRFKETYYLIMEFIEPNNKHDHFWQLFGQKLALMHRKSEDKFGLKYNNYIGSLLQDNTFDSNLVDFFINNRILPQLRMLEKKLSVNLDSYFNNFFKFLPEIIPLEKPSLIHGDLWNGNYLVNNYGEPTLIDPSIYYGCREFDIAMTKLFGGFPQDFYVAYNKEFPLYEKWEERVDIWNLYPLLVHANLFGDSYLQQIFSILQRFKKK